MLLRLIIAESALLISNGKTFGDICSAPWVARMRPIFSGSSSATASRTRVSVTILICTIVRIARRIGKGGT